MIIKTHPSNKEHFIKLNGFCKEVLGILKELKVTPVLWGSLAYFAYTKDIEMAVNDIDFLVPKESIKIVIESLKASGANYNYIMDWDSLQILKGDLKIELDPIEDCNKGKVKTIDIDFDGLVLKVMELELLKNTYRNASKTSKDNPAGYLKKWKRLNSLR